ncbi:MAG TPA: hypothetical protein VF070_01125 [Streptosporangiaceae bacterium]
MNEMDELSRFRAEIPVRGTTRAEEIFRTALHKDLSYERPVVSRPRNLLRQLRPSWRVAIAVPLALGLAAGITVAVLPGGENQAATPLTAQLLADRAAAAALATPAVSAGQWVYQRLEFNNVGPRNITSSQDGWMTADGTLSYGAGSIGDPIFPYNRIGSLPRDPAALDKYFRSLDPVASDNNSSVEFSQIEEMLFGMILPPWLEAEMFHALALIPHIQVRQHVKDIAGRDGVAFVLPPTKQSEQLEIILDASDYHLLAQASWDNPSNPATLNEAAILKTVLVAELGSTQPATAPPSAAELAAERVNFANTHLRRPPRRLTSGQWLYRDLRSGGKDQEVWATADDSEQAEFVNGTLRVCKRTDPCAASEQWLVPAGPSYNLIYPPYPPYPTNAAIKRYFYDLQHHIKATNPFKPVKPLPTLPSYPRPLLDNLNTYRTGCADVAGDCNAVNVAANVFTGYGNQPGTAASWFLALADVPGVSVQNVTDVAGQRDIEFTFPFTDGVTGLLLNASTYQFAGYVKAGAQSLLLKQAMVPGPGVLPGK